MIGRLLTLDSGRATGFALFQNGVLVAAQVLSAEDVRAPAGPCPLPSCQAHPCPHHASGAGRLVGELRAAADLSSVDLGAVEVPELWRTTPDLPGLLRLAGTGGALVGALYAAGVPAVLTFTPKQYRGGTPKDVSNMRTLAALAEEERRLVPRGPRSGFYSPDACDAVQLGLWLLRRTDRWLVDPRTFAEEVEPAPQRRRRKAPRGSLQCGLALAGPAPGGTPRSPR